VKTEIFSQPPISFLYVEDDPVTRNIMEKIFHLKLPGVSLHVAENGRVGLELYKKHAPEIVITDVNMPVMDGIEMAAEIKSVNPGAIIIAISAYSNTEYLLNSIEIGINHYVLKPIDFDKLFATIDKCLASISRSRTQQNP
jgi:YesN/AraC family two-component response regulator